MIELNLWCLVEYTRYHLLLRNSLMFPCGFFSQPHDITSLQL